MIAMCSYPCRFTYHHLYSCGCGLPSGLSGSLLPSRDWFLQKDLFLGEAAAARKLRGQTGVPGKEKGMFRNYHLLNFSYTFSFKTLVPCNHLIFSLIHCIISIDMVNCSARVHKIHDIIYLNYVLF